MLKHYSLASALGILAFLLGAPLQANDIYDTFAADEAAAPEVPEPAPSVADGQPIDAADSVYTLSDPACCNGYDGQSCLENACCNGSEFDVRFVPYGWLFSIHGDATVRGLTAPVDVSMRNTLNILEHNVHFIFSGKLEVENDEVGLLINGFYINAGFDTRLPRVNFDSTFKMAIVDMVATYNILHNSECCPNPNFSRFDLLAGVRYWQLDGGVTVTGPLGNTRGRSGEREWVDPIVGARMIVPICEGAEAQLRGDVGGFDWGTASEFTWNLEALVSMRMCNCVSFRGGYRVLDVDNQQDSGNNRFGFDMQFRGPVAEIAIDF